MSDRTPESSEDGAVLVGYTRRIGDTIKHAAWNPAGKYIGTFYSRSQARRILRVDAKLAAADAPRTFHSDRLGAVTIPEE